MNIMTDAFARTVAHVNTATYSGISLIERTDSVIKLSDTKEAKYERTGSDTRTFAWRERNPYTMKEQIVSRTYTFNGKDAWDITSEARL